MVYVIITTSLSLMHDSPVVAFIIGLSIILLASILNAGGLNLTKLDHVHILLIYIYTLSFSFSLPGQVNRSTQADQKKGLYAPSMAPRNASLHASPSPFYLRDSYTDHTHTVSPSS